MHAVGHRVLHSPLQLVLPHEAYLPIAIVAEVRLADDGQSSIEFFVEHFDTELVGIFAFFFRSEKGEVIAIVESFAEVHFNVVVEAVGSVYCLFAVVNGLFSCELDVSIACDE